MSIDEDEEAGRKRLVAYRMMAESAEKAQDRRQEANNFFIVMNGAIGGGYAFMVENDHYQLIKYTAVIGCFICILWAVTLLYYRALLSAKFRITAEYEAANELPGFDYEWRLFSKSLFGRLRIGNVRFSLSSLEMLIAVFAFAAHLAAPWALHKLVRDQAVEHVVIQADGLNVSTRIERTTPPKPTPAAKPATPAEAPKKVHP